MSRMKMVLGVIAGCMIDLLLFLSSSDSICLPSDSLRKHCILMNILQSPFHKHETSVHSRVAVSTREVFLGRIGQLVYLPVD